MANLKILLVEDESAVREFCAAVLVDAGYDPITAVDGFDGLNTFRRDHSQIRLIISDVTMPRLSGLELIREAAMVDPETKVLLMSGYGAPSVLPDTVCAVLAKPFGPRQLIEAVSKCLFA